MSNLGNKQIMANNIRYYMNIHSVSQTELMANYFGVTKADLVEDHSSRSHLTQCQTKDEETLVLSYRELNDINKKKCRIHKQSLINSTYGRRTPHRSRPH